MQPSDGLTCGEYLTSYASVAMGSIYNPDAMSDCQYCTMSNADQYLASVSISYTTRWRDYGIGFSYIVFNIFAAVLFYYFFRVRKRSGKPLGEKFASVLKVFGRGTEKENKGDEMKKTPQNPAEPVLPK